MSERIVQVGSLRDFCEDVPSGKRVRLQYSFTDLGGLPNIRQQSLDLFGINDEDEIVWLQWSWKNTFEDGMYWNKNQQAIYELMPKIRDLIREHLTELGYEVRSGGYAISKEIRPTNGQFECLDVRVKDGVATLKVKTDEPG